MATTLSITELAIEILHATNDGIFSLRVISTYGTGGKRDAQCNGEAAFPTTP